MIMNDKRSQFSIINDVMNEKRSFPLHEQSWYKAAMQKNSWVELEWVYRDYLDVEKGRKSP